MLENLNHWYAASKLATRLVIVVSLIALGGTLGGLILSSIRQAERERLVAELAIPDHAHTLQIIERLRARGWLDDEDSLRGVDLVGADLAGADLTGVDMQRALLIGANLRGARGLSDEQFALARSLWRTTMPDGSRYDGRYRLYSDLQLAQVHGVDADNLAAMADFYGVSPEVYERGQVWADEHLDAVQEAAMQAAANQVDGSTGSVEPGGVAVLLSVVFSLLAAWLIYWALPDASAVNT